MKTKLFSKLIKLAAFAPALAFAQDANLTLDGFNSYYNTYSNSTKNITGIDIEVGADGSNSNNYISSDFEVSLYLLACNSSGSATSSTPIIIATYTVFGNSMHQMGTYTFSNQTIDLSQVSGLADGMYRMGAWVNSDPTGNGIGDPPDYQSDNAGLMQSSAGTSSGSVINFTAASGISKYEAEKYLSMFPVPVVNEITLRIEKITANSIEVVDVNGGVVKQVNEASTAANNQELKVDVSTLTNGIYFVKMLADNKVYRKKFIVNH